MTADARERGDAAPMRPVLRGIAALAVLLACAGHADAQAPADARAEAVGDAVVFDGRIGAGSAADFLRLLQDPKIKRLVITSGGGLVDAALDMAFAIHERQLDVEVPTSCRSSCANYIFPAARHKTLGRHGAVAWHGDMAHVLHLQQTGQANWNESQMDSARRLARRETEFFGRAGVDGFVCWFAKIEPHQVEDFYALSVEDMEGFGIREVSVRDEPAGRQGDKDVVDVRVDRAGLEAARPRVRLDR